MTNHLLMETREPFPTKSLSGVLKLVLVFFVVALLTGCATTVRKEETLAQTFKGWDTAELGAYDVYAHVGGGSLTAVVLDMPHDAYRFTERSWNKRDVEWIAALVRARDVQDMTAGRLTDDSEQLLGYVFFVGTDWQGEQGAAHLTILERDNPGKYCRVSRVMYSPPRDVAHSN